MSTICDIPGRGEKVQISRAPGPLEEAVVAEAAEQGMSPSPGSPIRPGKSESPQAEPAEAVEEPQEEAAAAEQQRS
jgi:hypothetical protein